MMRRLGWCAASGMLVLEALGLIVLLPASGSAYTAKGVGVITALRGQGTVTHPPDVAAREGRPPREPLAFRGDVFYRDVVDTQRDTLVKVLLGGRSTITVRELSRVEIREGAPPAAPRGARSIVNLLAGAFRAIVSRDLMRGDELEVRTPNAVAAIRGTDVVVEVYDGTPPPLPAAEIESAILPASYEVAQAVPVTRLFVLDGEVTLPGTSLGPLQGVQWVENLPPQLFRFPPDFGRQLAGRFAVAARMGPIGPHRARMVGQLGAQAAADAMGHAVPGAPREALRLIERMVDSRSRHERPRHIETSFRTDVFLGSLIAPNFSGFLGGPGAGPFHSVFAAQTGTAVCCASGRADVRMTGTFVGPAGNLHIQFLLPSGGGAASFTGPVVYDGRALRGNLQGAVTVCDEGCLTTPARAILRPRP